MELTDARQLVWEFHERKQLSHNTYRQFNTLFVNIDDILQKAMKVYVNNQQQQTRKVDEIMETYYYAMSLLEEQLFWYQMGGCDE